MPRTTRGGARLVVPRRPVSTTPRSTAAGVGDSQGLHHAGRQHTATQYGSGQVGDDDLELVAVHALHERQIHHLPDQQPLPLLELVAHPPAPAANADSSAPRFFRTFCFRCGDCAALAELCILQHTGLRFAEETKTTHMEDTEQTDRTRGLGYPMMLIRSFRASTCQPHIPRHAISSGRLTQTQQDPTLHSTRHLAQTPTLSHPNPRHLQTGPPPVHADPCNSDIQGTPHSKARTSRTQTWAQNGPSRPDTSLGSTETGPAERSPTRLVARANHTHRHACVCARQQTAGKQQARAAEGCGLPGASAPEAAPTPPSSARPPRGLSPMQTPPRSGAVKVRARARQDEACG
eukprot:2485574-Rhodomonas_salina.1